jgi:H+/Cl- antiporter ClcA
MKKLIVASIIARGLGGTLGYAGATVQAGVAHHRWVHDNAPHATAPHVDTTVHQSP